MDTSLELFAALQEAFDEDKECEHPAHNESHQRVYHAGKAEWYAQMQCRVCDHKSAVVAVCDKYVECAKTAKSYCTKCRTSQMAHFVVLERIK